MSDLKEYFDNHNCDKAEKHNYHKVYEKEFNDIRIDEINILEVGIFKGDSIRAWLDYFPNATIYAIDTFQRILPQNIDILEHPRVKWMRADSTNIVVREQIKQEWPRIRFDIVIDDGLHTPGAQAKTYMNLSPLVKKIGAYYIEDVIPLDIMSQKEKSHNWIQKNIGVFNMNQWSKLAYAIEGKKVTRFDLREESGQIDSYIIKVK